MIVELLREHCCSNKVQKSFSTVFNYAQKKKLLQHRFKLEKNPDLPVESFGGAHKGRVCVRMFIGISVRACCERLRQKKKLLQHRFKLGKSPVYTHQLSQKVRFSTFNYETEQHRPFNCQNRTNLASRVVLKVVFHFARIKDIQFCTKKLISNSF